MLSSNYLSVLWSEPDTRPLLFDWRLKSSALSAECADRRPALRQLPLEEPRHLLRCLWEPLREEDRGGGRRTPSTSLPIYRIYDSDLAFNPHV